MDDLPILLPAGMLTAAMLAALGGLWRPAAARAVALVATAAATAVAAVALVHVLDDGGVRHHVGGWAPPIGIEFVLDPLSAFLAVVIAFIGLLVVLYPPRAGYGEEPVRAVPVHALTLLLLTGLFGVAMTGDLFNLFVFLEVYALATYGLVALGGPKAALASFRYLLFATIGGGFYLLGVGFVYFTTGTLNMADAAERLPPIAGSPTVVAAAVLITVALGIKMALFPLHVWLPDAHSHAPPAVAALLAAIQVKVAAYALIRVLLTVFGIEVVLADLPIMTIITWFGAAGVVFGSVMAIRQDDFKRLLAYSTVAQIGYIGLGIGLATPLALAGALLHVVNHAFMKACLFFVAGGVIQQAGVKSIRRFAGLGRRMPWTMAGFTVATLSMIGVPPTAGFFSKWYLVLGSLEADQWLLAAVIVVSSLLTLGYFLRVFEQVHVIPEPDPAVAKATEAGAGILTPVLVLAVGLLVLGLANVAIVDHVLDPIATLVLDG